MIDKEFLLKRLSELEVEFEQAKSSAHALSGAIVLLKQLIAKTEQDD